MRCISHSGRHAADHEPTNCTEHPFRGADSAMESTRKSPNTTHCSTVQPPTRFPLAHLILQPRTASATAHRSKMKLGSRLQAEHGCVNASWHGKIHDYKARTSSKPTREWSRLSHVGHMSLVHAPTKWLTAPSKPRMVPAAGDQELLVWQVSATSICRKLACGT